MSDQKEPVVTVEAIPEKPKRKQYGVPRKRYRDPVTGETKALPHANVKDAKSLQTQLQAVTDLVLSTHQYLANIREFMAAEKQKLQIDPMTVRNLASIGVSQQDMANILGCSTSTLQAGSLRAAYEEGFSELKAGIGKKMIEKALDGKGDATMLIWLSKQYMGFRDSPATQVNIQNNVEQSGLREKLKAALSIEPTSAVTVVDVPPTESNE